MLQTAHAAMYFWKSVGNANNRAHAAQLVAHVYAFKLPNPAKHYLKQSQPFFQAPDTKPWELALSHAVAANVAAAAGEGDAHARHYAEAVRALFPSFRIPKTARSWAPPCGWFPLLEQTRV